MTFYTPQGALDWLKGKVSELFAARGVLQDTYGRALAVQSKRTTPENRVRVDQLVQDLTTALQDQTSLEQKVRYIVPESWIPQSLGIAPLIIGVGAIAVAGAVALHLQRVFAHRETLALVEKGVLTPAQAVQIEQAGSILGAGGLTGLTGNISTILWVSAAGLALYLFGPALSRLGRK